MNKAALKKAVRLAGGQAPLAAKLAEIMGKPIKQAHVWNWLNRDSQLPGEACIPVEKAVSGQVTRQDLRPDLYPREGRAA